MRASVYECQCWPEVPSVGPKDDDDDVANGNVNINLSEIFEPSFRGWPSKGKPGQKTSLFPKWKTFHLHRVSVFIHKVH